MRVLLLGAGFIAQTHIKALLANGINDILIVDRNKAQAEELATTYNLCYVGTNYYELPANLAYDSVHICTVPSEHYAAIKYFLAQGKLVVCEKPLCLDAEQAKDLEPLLLSHAEQFLICYNNRYYSGAKTARQNLLSGQYGRPLLLYGTYEQSFHIPPTPYSWRFDSHAGNYLRAVSEIGSHLIDLTQYWLDSPIVKVSGRFSKRQVKLYKNQAGMLLDAKDALNIDVTQSASTTPSSITEQSSSIVKGCNTKLSYETTQSCQTTPTTIAIENEDIAIINLELANGSLANLLVSEVSAACYNELSLTAIMEQGRLQWENKQTDELQISKDKLTATTLKLGMGSSMQDSYIEMFKHFYNRAIRHEVANTYANSEQACKAAIENVLVCAKLYESACNDGKYLEVENASSRAKNSSGER